MSDPTPRQQILVKARGTARERFWSEYDRESYRCPVCGSDGPFEVHHRDGDAFNNHFINLLAVCESCHRREHKRRARIERVAAWKDQVEDLGVTA